MDARLESLEQEYLQHAREQSVWPPKRATLWHDEALVVTGNPIARTVDTAQLYNFVAGQSAAANGDTFTHGCFLRAGTYTLSILGKTNTNRGLLDWTLDGLTVASAQDWYANPAVNNAIVTIANVAVLYDGWHVLTGVVNGKNASSSDYTIALTKYWFTPETD